MEENYTDPEHIHQIIKCKKNFDYLKPLKYKGDYLFIFDW